MVSPLEIYEDKGMGVEERRRRLSEIARGAEYGRQFRAADVLTAIDLLNKMESIYKQEVKIEHEVVHSFHFILPDGTEFKLPRIVNGQEIGDGGREA